MDRLDTLAAFVAVAERSSFSRAASQLRTSAPAVTRAIAALEQRLGVKLFSRTTRSVRLTEAGALFLERCRRVLGELEDAERAAAGAAAEPRGKLVITAPVVFGRMHVVPLVAELLKENPQVTAQLVLTDEPVSLVAEGVDVAVRIGALEDSRMQAIRVGAVRSVLVAAPAYLRRRGTPGSLMELEAHDLVVFTRITPSDVWRFGPGGKRAVGVRPRLLVNTAEAALAAAEEGLGITRVLSYQAAPALAESRLVELLAAEAPEPVPVHLLLPEARSASAATRAFVSLAKTRLRAQPALQRGSR